MDKIHYILVDHGDGTAGVLFYRYKENAQKILDQELDEHYMNEGRVSTLDLHNSVFEDN